MSQPAGGPSRPLHIGHVVLALHIGGLEMVVVNLVRASQRSGFKHTVFCLDDIGALADDVRRHGGTVVKVPRQVPRDFTLAARLAGLARRNKVDVLHAHNFTPFIYARLSRTFLAGVPVIATFHNTRLAAWGERRVKALKFLSRGTAALVAVSRKTQSVIEDMIGRPQRTRLVCIPNGVDVDRFRRASTAERDALLDDLNLGSGVRIVGSVGRLSAEKDYAMLIRAFEAVSRDEPSARLVIAGDGPERAALQQLIDARGLGRTVRLLGARQDVDRLLAAFDLFVLSSITEGTSVALLEAMASSLPIVATRVGGTADLITDGSDGVLVPSGDEAAMAYAIVRVFRDASLAQSLAAKGRHTIEADYSLQHMSDAYTKLYLESVDS